MWVTLKVVNEVHNSQRTSYLQHVYFQVLRYLFDEVLLRNIISNCKNMTNTSNYYYNKKTVYRSIFKKAGQIIDLEI